MSLKLFQDKKALQTENVYDEPYFRDTDRKGAKQLLHDLPDGAFLLRKSENYYIVLTIKYKATFVNLGIEKTSNGMIRLCGENHGSPEFPKLGHLVNYFTQHPLVFSSESGEIDKILLKKILPSCPPC